LSNGTTVCIVGNSVSCTYGTNIVSANCEKIANTSERFLRTQYRVISISEDAIVVDILEYDPTLHPSSHHQTITA
jgi:hypothetical protein